MTQGQLFPLLPMDPKYPLSQLVRIFRAPEPDEATFLEPEPAPAFPRDKG